MTLIRNLGMAALGGIAYLASACVPAQVATKPVTPVVEAKKKPKVDLEEFYGNLKLLVEKTLKNGEKLTGNFLEEMTYGAKGIKNPVDCSSLARYNTSKGDFALVVANSENRFAKYQGDFDDDSDPSMSLMINGMNMLAIDTYWQQFAIGAIVILSVWADQLQAKKFQAE